MSPGYKDVKPLPPTKSDALNDVRFPFILKRHCCSADASSVGMVISPFDKRSKLRPDTRKRSYVMTSEVSSSTVRGFLIFADKSPLFDVRTPFFLSLT